MSKMWSMFIEPIKAEVYVYWGGYEEAREREEKELCGSGTRESVGSTKGEG